eukprot:1053855_1
MFMCYMFYYSALVWIRGCRGNVLVDNNDIYMVHLTIMGWDVFVNAFCINLQFNAAQSIFDKFCGRCKRCLLRRFIQNIDTESTIHLKQYVVLKKTANINKRPRNIKTHSIASTLTGNTTTSTH